MLLFLNGCILFKTDLSGQFPPTSEPSIRMQQHAQLYAVMGPTFLLESGINNRRIAFGISGSTAGIYELFDPDWTMDCSFCHQSLLMSTLGLQALEWQWNSEGTQFGGLSPYIQLHLPFHCPLTENTRKWNAPKTEHHRTRCLSVFFSAEYQQLWNADNQNVFGLGFSYAFLESAW